MRRAMDFEMCMVLLCGGPFDRLVLLRAFELHLHVASTRRNQLETRATNFASCG